MAGSHERRSSVRSLGGPTTTVPRRIPGAACHVSCHFILCRLTSSLAGIRWWSPTQLLICRSEACVWQSGRDAQFSSVCDRMWHAGEFSRTIRRAARRPRGLAAALTGSSRRAPPASSSSDRADTLPAARSPTRTTASSSSPRRNYPPTRGPGPARPCCSRSPSARSRSRARRRS
ncbi:unnamed protein product [Diplocarpon coronariae]